MAGQRTLVIIGILLPVLLVLFMVGVVIVPRFLSKPTVNFVYATGLHQGYSGEAAYRDLPVSPGATVRTREYYIVRDGRLVRETRETPLGRLEAYPPLTDRTEVRLYLHDVRTNTSRPLTLEEATRVRLDDSAESSDGFRLTYHHGDSGGAIIFPFVFLDGGRGEGGWAVVGHGARHRMKLKDPSPNRYDRNVIFLGWVVNSSPETEAQ